MTQPTTTTTEILPIPLSFYHLNIVVQKLRLAYGYLKMLVETSKIVGVVARNFISFKQTECIWPFSLFLS